MANSRKQGNYHSIQWMLAALMLEVTLGLTESHTVCLILLAVSSGPDILKLKKIIGYD